MQSMDIRLRRLGVVASGVAALLATITYLSSGRGREGTGAPTIVVASPSASGIQRRAGSVQGRAGTSGKGLTANSTQDGTGDSDIPPPAWGFRPFDFGTAIAPQVSPFPSGRRVLSTSRRRYPRGIRTQLPAGLTAHEFVRSLLENIASLDPKGADAAQRHVQMENLLAETIVGVPEAEHELLDAARSGTAKLRDLALLFLGRVSDSAALGFLLQEGLVSPDASVRAATVRALSQDAGWNVQIGSDPDESATRCYLGPIADPEVHHALVRALSQESDAQVQKEIVVALSYQLLDGVLDGADGEQDRAAHPGGMQFAADTVAALRDLLHRSQDPELRYLALSCLGNSDSRDAAQLLGEQAREAPTPEERASAMRSLGSSYASGVDRLGPILDALGSPEAAIRRAAVDAAHGAGRDDDMYGRLVAMSIKDPDSEVRRRALKAALWNLILRQTRIGEAAPPDYPRAIQLVADAFGRAASSDEREDIASAAEEVVRRIHDGTRSGPRALGPEAEEQLHRVESLIREGMKRFDNAK